MSIGTYAYKIDEAYDGGENYGGPPYWGKYVFHDNNRDINYGVDTLRTYLNWYLHWVPPIWHDLHEAQTLLYTFSGSRPTASTSIRSSTPSCRSSRPTR